jgi:hypothetical protein
MTASLEPGELKTQLLWIRLHFSLGIAGILAMVLAIVAFRNSETPFVVSFVGGYIVLMSSIVPWRCARCHGWLGRQLFVPSFCPKCGTAMPRGS